MRNQQYRIPRGLAKDHWGFFHAPKMPTSRDAAEDAFCPRRPVLLLQGLGQGRIGEDPVKVRSACKAQEGSAVHLSGIAEEKPVHGAGEDGALFGGLRLVGAGNAHGRRAGPGADKAAGIRKMVRMLGGDLRDVVVFGDGKNDLSMFSKEWTCVAMENAVCALKEKAD